MAHLTEEDLVSYRNGDAPDPQAVRDHLAACADCRVELATLDRLFALMEAPVPEPGPAYEREMWARIQDRLVVEPRGGWRLHEWLGGGSTPSLGRWLLPQAGLAAMVALLLAGLVWFERPGGGSGIGSGTAASGPQQAAARGAATRPGAATPIQTAAASRQTPADAATIRSRVLVAAVGDHLQRAELLLTEFNNTDGRARGTIDLTEDQARAADLLSENRLYRRSAADVNEDQIVALLDDLERVLLEVAHAPAETTPERLDRLRLEIGSQDVLFKVRVVGAGMRDRQQMAAVDSPETRPLSGS